MTSSSAGEAWNDGELDAACSMFEAAAGRGSHAALLGLGSIYRDLGDLDRALSAFERAAARDDAGSAQMAAFIKHDQGDLEGAIRWMQRAQEMGDRHATRPLALLLVESGDDAAGTTMFEQGVEEGDPECAYALACRYAASKCLEEFAAYLGRYAKLAVDRELENEPWAHVDDIFELSDEQVQIYNAQMLRWCEPYNEIAAVVRDRGPFALPRPVGDPERTEVALQVALEWSHKLAARNAVRMKQAQEDEERASAAFHKATTRQPEKTVAGAGHAVYAWRADPVAIKGCRLLLDIGGPDTIPRVTVQLSHDAIALEVAGERRILDWPGVRSIQIDHLGDRARVTVPRAAGMGALSLAAKKRVGWCVMTMAWRDRHVVLEMPVEAHQIRAIFASASISIG